jgi:hypothetical protein
MCAEPITWTGGCVLIGAPLRASNDHIDFVATAARADEPLMPIGNGRLGAVALSHLGRIWLYLVAAISAPHDETNAGSSRAA